MAEESGIWKALNDDEKTAEVDAIMAKHGVKQFEHDLNMWWELEDNEISCILELLKKYQKR